MTRDPKTRQRVITYTCLPGNRQPGCTSPGVHVHIVTQDEDAEEVPTLKAVDDENG